VSMERGHGGSPEHWLGAERASDAEAARVSPFWRASEPIRAQDVTPFRRASYPVTPDYGRSVARPSETIGPDGPIQVPARGPIRRRRRGSAYSLPESGQGLSDRSVSERQGTPWEVSGEGPLTRVGEHPSKSVLPNFKVAIYDEAKGAIAEYTIDELDDKILNTLWNLSPSPGGNGFIRTEDIIKALDRDVHIVALYDPSKALLSGVGIPGASFWSSIIQDAPIGVIDKPLEAIELWAEIAGIIFGVLSGHLAMAFACFKALLHDEVHRLSVEAIEHLIDGDSSGGLDSDELMPSGTPAAHDADPETHSMKGNMMLAQAARADWERDARERVAQQRFTRGLSLSAMRERDAQEREAREQGARKRDAQATALRATQQRGARERAAGEQEATERSTQAMALRATQQRDARQRDARERQDHERVTQANAQAFLNGYSIARDDAAIRNDPIGDSGSIVKTGPAASISTSAPSGSVQSGNAQLIANCRRSPRAD